jgi:rabenosyn-5
MSRRTLGGGRVLGNPSALTTPSPQPKRVLSPTASSVSLNSQAASQLSTENQDLTSRISIENGESSISAAPAAPGAELSCPICSEQMVCLFLCRIYFLKIKWEDTNLCLDDFAAAK